MNGVNGKAGSGGSAPGGGGSRSGGPASPVRAFWWFHPVVYVAFLTVPLLLLAYATSEGTYATLYRTDKHIDFNLVVLGLVVYAGFILGSFVSVSFSKRPQEADVLLYCRWFVWPSFILMVFGHVVWFVSASLEAGGPGAVLSLFYELLFQPSVGLSDYIKNEVFATISGVTTLTQVAIVYVTLEMLLWVRGEVNRRVAIFRLLVLTAFILPRAFLLSGRLSLFEVAIPAAVVLVASLNLRGMKRTLVQLAPVFSGVGVFVLFVIGEYFRSWSYYKSLYSGTYMQFAFERFMGYYTTAFNNGAIYHYYLPGRPLRYTLNPAFELPIFGEMINNVYLSLVGSRGIVLKYPYEFILERYGNPEFNNISTVGLWTNEFTVFAAPIAAFLLGVLSISIYRSFLRGRLIGTVLFPSWFVGFLELPRVYFWADQRYFPALAAIFVFLLVFKIAKVPVYRRKPATRARSPEKVEDAVRLR